MKTKTKGLSEFVIETKKNTGIVDPKELAQEVYKNTSDSDKDAFYMTALTAYVQMRLASERNNVAKAASNSDRLPPHLNSAKSAKVAAIRNWWAEFCAQSLYTENGWKAMGDVTIADLKFAAQERRDKAAEALEYADKYDRLAQTMTKKKAKTVGELPEAAVRPIFS